MRFRDYFFTLNNWTDEEFDKIKKEVEKKASYAVIGKEVGKKTGTPHLQGFIYWKNEREFNSIKKLNQRAHFERKYLDSKFIDVIKYCKKEGDFWEFGSAPADRNVNVWQEVDEDISQGLSWDDLTKKYPELSIKYPGGLRNHFETHRPKYKYELPKPYRPFQQAIFNYINEGVDDRKVLWIYDDIGNSGKSKLADHLLCNNNFKVFTNGKTADIALAWNGENVIFDFSRSQQDHINYGVIEDLKNGRVFSPKYQSQVKFHKPIHLLVFANFKPDITKMSRDRWDIYEMTASKTLIQLDVDEL